MCSDCPANSLQLTWHPSEGGGDLICRGGSLPGHPAQHSAPLTCSQRRVKPSFGWVHAIVAVPGPGEPSKERHAASTPVPAGDRPDLSPRAASARQPASRHPWGKKSRLQPHPKMPARSQQPASHITLALAKAWTPCQLSTGWRRRTPKPAQSPISRKLTCLNKANK